MSNEAKKFIEAFTDIPFNNETSTIILEVTRRIKKLLLEEIVQVAAHEEVISHFHVIIAIDNVMGPHLSDQAVFEGLRLMHLLEGKPTLFPRPIGKIKTEKHVKAKDSSSSIIDEADMVESSESSENSETSVKGTGKSALKRKLSSLEWTKSKVKLLNVKKEDATSKNLEKFKELKKDAEDIFGTYVRYTISQYDMVFPPETVNQICKFLVTVGMKIGQKVAKREGDITPQMLNTVNVNLFPGELSHIARDEAVKQLNLYHCKPCNGNFLIIKQEAKD